MNWPCHAKWCRLWELFLVVVAITAMHCWDLRASVGCQRRHHVATAAQPPPTEEQTPRATHQQHVHHSGGSASWWICADTRSDWLVLRCDAARSLRPTEWCFSQGSFKQRCVPLCAMSCRCGLVTSHKNRSSVQFRC